MREPEEFAAGAISSAIPIDRAELALIINQLVPALATPNACWCARGNRSALAAYQLQQLGYDKVASLGDGLDHWDQKNPYKAQRSSWTDLLGQAHRNNLRIGKTNPT